jgi:NitT/TauT family transport system substrate-binding protein
MKLWQWTRRGFASVALLVASLLGSACAAETLKISVIKAASYGPFFVAQDKGYFTAEGLDVQFVFFEASPPIAVAVVSGDLDFGIGATSAAFFSLGDKLRIIGGFAREAPGFQGMTFVASNRGFAEGVKSLKDLANHSVAIGTIGSSPHYSLALIEEKYGIDPKSVRVLPLQTVSNQVSALIGGQADAGVTIAAGLMPAVGRSELKLLGFMGDEVPWQLSSIFTATKTADDRRDTVVRFLRAYRKGAHAYVDAFAGADGERRDGPTAPEILAITAKYVGQTPEELKTAIGYVDPEARVDAKDLQRQVVWYKAQGMLKGEVDASAVLDKHYAVLLPGR